MLIASRSSCGRLNVGCVLVSSGEHPHRIIAAGYNGWLPGTSHTSRIRDDHDLGPVHAEQNAVTDAARRGVSVAGATAYITHFPCIHCAKILVAAGICAIKFHADYKNDPFVYEILEEAHILVEQL
ncbi:MAG: dCMP deaminase [Verrucomicrobia bacterium GWF2_51_19]|nr:MAG: dCMP deaminase [Verrucomicrobia bacterium GWF2_51_19]